MLKNQGGLHKWFITWTYNDLSCRIIPSTILKIQLNVSLLYKLKHALIQIDNCIDKPQTAGDFVSYKRLNILLRSVRVQNAI